ncbi:SDR family oxidoreductase [Ralstonia pickettii]|uniref:SDR family oxidoreductase n=1 Tax=Ralstonia pickettii TaxID=329 RepID=UPI000818B851|nr:SDR family oxidoreductase [Ralstonia pickettii]OCS44219.1 3-oxoacyl-ACP reductase [Ralstonia pickettii]
MRLAGKIAIVTGAGSGFGEGIANTFAREGARVVVNDLNAEAGERVASAIRVAGGDAHFVHADVSNGDSVAKLLGATLARYGGLDIVVNNAGTTHKNKPLLQITEDEFDRVMAVNVKSIYWTAHHIVPHFRERGGGVFVNVVSTAGIRPRPGLVWYNASKGAVITASKAMAAELGPDKIRVNCVNPVMGATGLIEQFMGVPDTPENRARFLATIPMGRLSTPQDVANACLYLASDEAEFITGACLEVDGGRCV